MSGLGILVFGIWCLVFRESRSWMREWERSKGVYIAIESAMSCDLSTLFTVIIIIGGRRPFLQGDILFAGCGVVMTVTPEARRRFSFRWGGMKV